MRSLRVVWKLSLILAGLGVIGSFVHLLAFLPRRWRLRLAPRLRPLYPNLLHRILGLKVRCHNPERLALGPDRAILLVPNHSTFLDITVLGAVFRTTFVSKHTVAYWPVIGSALWLLGVIYMDRASTEDRLRILVTLGEHLAPGEILTVFPQGGASPDSQRRPFFRGIFKLPELYPYVSIVPVTLSYRDADAIAWHEESLWNNVCRLCARSSINVDVYIHEPLGEGALKGRRARIVAQEVASTVFSRLEPVPAPATVERRVG